MLKNLEVLPSCHLFSSSPCDEQRPLSFEEMRAVAVHEGFTQFADVDFRRVLERVRFINFYRDVRRLPVSIEQLTPAQLSVVKQVPLELSRKDYKGES